MNNSIWMSLPEHVWMEILDKLDTKSLLATTETCKSLAEYVGRSKVLMKKITLNLLIADVEIMDQLQALATSQREYRNLKVGSADETSDQDERVPSDLELVRNIFSHTVTSIEMRQLTWHAFDFVLFLAAFGKLEKCMVVNCFPYNTHYRYLYEDAELQAEIETHAGDFTNLIHLSLKECHSFFLHMFYKSFKLKQLNIDSFGYDKIHIPKLEAFFQELKDLKELNLSGLEYAKFELNNAELCSNPPFQLTSLTIDSFYWTNLDLATAFLTSQRHLKSIQLHLKSREFGAREFPYRDQVLMFTYVLQQIFKHNYELENVMISTTTRESFIICCPGHFREIQCPKVKSLEYRKGFIEETSSTMEAFVKMFPNVEHFTFQCFSASFDRDFDLISSWTKLKFFSLMISPEVGLDSLQVTSQQFESFQLKFIAQNNAELSDMAQESIRFFFLRHQSIIMLSINSFHYYDKDIQEATTLIAPLITIIANSLPGLEELEVSEFVVDCEMVETICGALNNLRLLKLKSQSHHLSRIQEICDIHQVKVELPNKEK